MKNTVKKIGNAFKKESEMTQLKYTKVNEMTEAQAKELIEWRRKKDRNNGIIFFATYAIGILVTRKMIKELENEDMD